MNINSSSLNAIFLNLKATFNDAFAATESTYEEFAITVPSNGRFVDYRWLERFPRMRKWVGEKTLKRLSEHGYTIVNNDFEATVEVDRNDIEDDQLGILLPQAKGAGQSAKELPDELIYDLINQSVNGTSPCYDGKPFFSATHQVGGTKKVSFSNKGTLKLTISSLAAAQASYGAYRTEMRKFKDDEMRPLGVRPRILLVPPALEDIANALMTNDRLEDGKPNPYKGTAKVIVGDKLTSDTAWFLIDNSKPMKPLIYQLRKAPVFVQMTDMNSPKVFMEKTFLFGAEARAAAGYGFWQLMFCSDGSTGPA